MKLAKTISSLILELISCPPQCKAFANLFTEPQHSSSYMSLSASLPCTHTFAGTCLTLPSCHHLVFFQVKLGLHPPRSPPEGTRGSLAECSSARSVYTEGCHPPEEPPKPFSSKEKVLSQTSDLARSL